MKNKLENAFKESLQNYEAPYDPKAWEAVSAKLGAPAATATGKGASTSLKWVAIGVLVGSVAVGSLFFFNSTESTTVEDNVVVENKERKATKTQQNIVVEEKEVETNTATSTPQEDNTFVENNAADNASEDIASSTEVTSSQSQSNANTNASTTGNISNDGTIRKDTKVKDPKKANYIAGVVSKNVICKGEEVTISNPENESKVKVEVEARTIVLEKGKSYTFKPETTAKITYLDADGIVIANDEVIVNEAAAVNFAYEANVFEKGLPVANFEAYGDYEAYEWIYNNTTFGKKSVAQYNFYDKGVHKVSLKVKDRNGCEGIHTKTITVRDKYNLMAVDAFSPDGTEAKNRTFIPYSLVERPVKFEMTIIDPIDNGLVFSTSDASNAWDGVDQRTGKMTPSNKTYIWKVQLHNPEENERPIYAGTILHK